MLDIKKPRTIKCRYNDAKIPAGVKRIFTSNRKPVNIFPQPSGRQQKIALQRRYRAVCIQQKLYVGGDDEAGDDDGYQE